jgi:hypothetical protein
MPNEARWGSPRDYCGTTDHAGRWTRYVRAQWAVIWVRDLGNRKVEAFRADDWKDRPERS